MAGLLPTPPTVTRAPLAARPSSKLPAELVIRLPLTLTVLNCPPAWELKEIPRLSSATNDGSLVLTGTARPRRVVCVVGPLRPPSSTAIERTGSAGFEKMTTRAVPSTPGFSVWPVSASPPFATVSSTVKLNTPPPAPTAAATRAVTSARPVSKSTPAALSTLGRYRRVTLVPAKPICDGRCGLPNDRVAT